LRHRHKQRKPRAAIACRDELRAELLGDPRDDRQAQSLRSCRIKVFRQAGAAVGDAQTQTGILLTPASDLDRAATFTCVGVLAGVDRELVDSDGELLSHVGGYVDGLDVDGAGQAGAERDRWTQVLEKGL
jgi:hypothetical protein